MGKSGQTLILSPKMVRRLAITRQRLAGPRPDPAPEGIMEVMRDLRCVQIDPIRAVECTQYLVLWSRLGQYDPAHLDELLWKERRLFEYWAHDASIVLAEDFALFRPLMQRYPAGHSKWQEKVRAWLAANKTYRRYVLAQLRRRGPLASDEIEDRAQVPWESGGWTSGRNASQMLNFLWSQGKIAVAERQGLRKKWALMEHCLPTEVVRQKLPECDIVRRAVQLALRGLGAATVQHMKNHFVRGCYANLERVLAELVDEGRVAPVAVEEGRTAWPGSWYMHSDDVELVERLREDDWQPRTTLLSPFDNLICNRERTQLLWDFRFRLEIYVPKTKRQYGYYVLPILCGDRFIGRIDPRMERKTGALQINAVHAEKDAPMNAETGKAVGQAIEALAQFLGARRIDYNGQVPAGWHQFLGHY